MREEETPSAIRYSSYYYNLYMFIICDLIAGTQKSENHKVCFYVIVYVPYLIGAEVLVLFVNELSIHSLFRPLCFSLL